MSRRACPSGQISIPSRGTSTRVSRFDEIALATRGQRDPAQLRRERGRVEESLRLNGDASVTPLAPTEAERAGAGGPTEPVVEIDSQIGQETTD